MKISTLSIALAASLQAPLAQAQTIVKDAWVRSTVAQQMATGAFMQLTSAQGGKLVGVASPAAGMVELHQMAMDGNVMKMRAVPSLDLPAGKSVALEAGGYHVMMMDLKAPLKAGDMVQLTLTIEHAGGQRETLQVQAAVRATVGALGK